MASAPDFDVQLLDWSRVKPLAESVRRQVFIEEQAVPEDEEWDRLDDFAVHALVVIDGTAVATGRLSRDSHIGRMAVLKPYRQRGIGTALLWALLEAARERGLQRIDIHAQSHACGFYQSFGFIPDGEPFLEVDIPHQKMHIQL